MFWRGTFRDFFAKKSVNKLITKPTTHAISVVVKKQDDKTLFVFRSKTMPTFPGVWSLPSTNVESGETHEEAMKRMGKERLGVTFEPVRMLNEKLVERDDYFLFMHDYEATMTGDIELVERYYSNCKWENPERQFAQMSVMGDCCKVYREFLREK